MSQNFEQLVIDNLGDLKRELKSLKKEERITAEKIHDELSKIKVEIATIKVKASLLGGLGGLISLAIMMAINFLNGK